MHCVGCRPSGLDGAKFKEIVGYLVHRAHEDGTGQATASHDYDVDAVPRIGIHGRCPTLAVDGPLV